MNGRQCYSPMSPDSVSILLIDVSCCGECTNSDLMNQMLQNMTVMARAQSCFGQALASTEKTVLCVIENGTLTALRYCNEIFYQFVRPYAGAIGPEFIF